MNGSPLRELAGLRLAEAEWAEVADELAALDPMSPDTTAVSQVVFEAKVRQTFHAGRSSSTLAPTKQTSALPWVGVVCGLMLLVVGGLLGGGAILVVVVALSLGVMGVAVAGSRVAHRRREGRQAADVVEVVPAPERVVELIERLEATP